MFFSVHFVSVYRAQEPMIGDSRVAARLAFWWPAKTIVITLIQWGLPDTLFWLFNRWFVKPSYLENVPRSSSLSAEIHQDLSFGIQWYRNHDMTCFITNPPCHNPRHLLTRLKRTSPVRDPYYFDIQHFQGERTGERMVGSNWSEESTTWVSKMLVIGPSLKPLGLRRGQNVWTLQGTKGLFERF